MDKEEKWVEDSIHNITVDSNNPSGVLWTSNSLVIFQTIMNKILWNLINTREVVGFIDDIIVGMKKEERHDEVVEEVIKRLAENNLYVKPEKYKWKIREVRFLGVVIGPEEIKMEEERVKEILEKSQRYTEVFRTSQLLLAVH